MIENLSAQFIFNTIIIVIVISFILERFLDFLNSKTWSTELPEKLAGIYKEEDYQKAMIYGKTNAKFSFIVSCFGFILMFLMLCLNGFAFVDDIAYHISSNTIINGLLFFGILFFASDLINLPFSIYSTFVIEEKFGFNKTTAKTFILDKLKTWLLGVVIGGGVIALIYWFYELTEEWFWIYTWGAMTFFMIFMSMFYSSLIVPLFNKQKPLEDGELRNAIEEFCLKVGFNLDNVFVIDGSKRSTKANAYFSGLGRRKRIVLYDTLISDMSNNELVAVLAHEVGHYKKKHTAAGMVLSVIQSGLMLYILSVFIGTPSLSEAMGADHHSFHMALIAFGILYSPISFLLGIFMNVISRKNEYQADRFAAENFSAEELGKALKNLSVKNLSNLTPHPLYVFFNYSHPTLLQRLKSMGI